jgi:thermostable 8-oxoguanine DNA glycosylase
MEELIKENLDTNEHAETLKLINELKDVKKRGYLKKDEFMKIVMWKSPRPKQLYLQNSEEEIISISKKVLATKFEKRRIELLTSFKGVSIPAASAFLTMIDPQNYGVIDIRVWQVLFLYGSVKVKPDGINFDFNNWYNYLMKLRFYAKKFKVSARDIERTIFFHHRNIQEGNLYKKTAILN